MIEDFHYCKGGSITSSDKCAKVAFANLTISNDLSLLTITFSKNMKIRQSLLAFDFSLEVKYETKRLEIHNLDLLS